MEMNCDGFFNARENSASPFFKDRWVQKLFFTIDSVCSHFMNYLYNSGSKWQKRL